MREYDMFICDYVLINTAARLPPALVDVCRARHGPLFWSICRGLFLVSGKELTCKKPWSILLSQKHLILYDLNAVCS